MPFFRHLLLLVLLLLCKAGSIIAADTPTVIRVGYYIKSMKVNNKDENAELDFYYWYRFKMPKDTAGLRSVYSLEYVNGDIISNEVFEEKVINDEYYVTGRLKGNFGFSSDFTNYPFDKQKLLIQLEHSVFTDDQMIFLADSSSYLRSRATRNFWGISEALDSKDLILTKSEFLNDSRLYNTDFGDIEMDEKGSSYSRLSFFLYVKRDAGPYVLKFMLPLIFILSLAYLVFYIPAEDMELACGLTVTSLLAAIAFQWTVSDDLPNVGYMTCVDKIFYLGYGLIMLAMVQTVFTYHLEKDGKVKLSNTLEILGRWLFPLIFIGGTLYFIFRSY